MGMNNPMERIDTSVPLVPSNISYPETYIPENRHELDERIHSLKEDILISTEKLRAVENSKKSYGEDVAFSAMVDGVEITPELVTQKKQMLEALENSKKAMKPKRTSILASLRSLLG